MTGTIGLRTYRTANAMSTITSPLAAALKDGTQDLHVAAERHPLQQRLLRGAVSRDELALYLHELYHVHLSLETGLNSSNNPAVHAMVRDHHLRSPLFKHDIAALGGTIADQARCRAARSFCGFIGDAAAADPAALVGMLYVLEGATNGNVYLARALERSLGLEPQAATSSLDPHGADQRPRWQAFRVALDTLDLPDADAARVIAAARSTFRAVYDIADELAPQSP
ncbi:MAG: biliverdin-producing heme oxygenase [Phycisphaerae bacterium]|nr:biliverdin-producing heme oxygenase [Phycisphaerae bacterium]